jgi:hypothetical protein
MTQTNEVIVSGKKPMSISGSTPVPYSAGDKASYVAAGTCQAGVALEDAFDTGMIMVPSDAGIYELCYQSTGKSPAVQTGQVLKVLADYSPSQTGVTPSMSDSAWGIDYSALMSGKSKEVIHGLDKIIRYGATDPYTDATVTWLKNYHNQVAAGLPASGTQLRRIDESASLMFVGLAAK